MFTFFPLPHLSLSEFFQKAIWTAMLNKTNKQKTTLKCFLFFFFDAFYCETFIKLIRRTSFFKAHNTTELIAEGGTLGLSMKCPEEFSKNVYACSPGWRVCLYSEHFASILASKNLDIIFCLMYIYRLGMETGLHIHICNTACKMSKSIFIFRKKILLEALQVSSCGITRCQMWKEVSHKIYSRFEISQDIRLF